MCDISGCHSILASVLFLCNIVFFLLGSIIAGIGIYGLLDPDDYFALMGDDYFPISVIMVSVGSVVVIMSFCGCCGICTETAWLVQLYR